MKQKTSLDLFNKAMKAHEETPLPSPKAPHSDSDSPTKKSINENIEVIYQYTIEQSIKDGLLVDITQRLLGHHIQPTYILITKGLLEHLSAPRLLALCNAIACLLKRPRLQEINIINLPLSPVIWAHYNRPQNILTILYPEEY